jgi:flagellar biosynthesis anti-sigma factor FlgM
VSALSSDQAKVSAAASQVSISASEPDVRLEKVTAIRNAIQQGSYEVPAADVAAKLISSLLTNEI